MSENPQSSVFNPDTEDFTITYDLNGDNHPLSYTVRANDHATFPTPVAEHIKRHLAKHLVFKRGIKTNFEDEYNKTIKEISYDIF